ncbi:MAG: hypothetical protein JSV99_05210 [Planctomycetota bacterium]|nr:MAG: hypothetical protein JSV99_05210 [Planctomycetota bacterium]
MEANEGNGQQGEVLSEQAQTGGGKNWKTAIFVLVVLAVAAVGAHSVLTNGKAGGPCGIVCSPDKVVGNNPECTVEKKVCAKEAAPASENKTCENAKQYIKESQCPQSKQTSKCPLSNKDKPAPSCCPKSFSSCCPKGAASAESK